MRARLPSKNPKAEIEISEIPEPVATFGVALRKLREPEALLFPVQRDRLDTLTWLSDFEGMRAFVEEFEYPAPLDGGDDLAR